MSDSKKKTPAKKPTHPKYSEMISAAITSLKERGGSSRVAILKFIVSKYKVSDNSGLVNTQLKHALKKGVVKGSLLQVKGAGASGSFKLSKAAGKPKSPKKKPAAKKLKPKSPKAAAKKPKAKKPAAKKPKAAKKSPKKAAKPKPKKVAAKKPAKKAAKPKAKKPAKKTAKK